MKSSIRQEQSDYSFEKISEKRYYPHEFDEAIKKSTVLILPFENFRDGYEILFPETTKELFRYLKENEQNRYRIEVVASDDDFKEIELHDASILIASILIQSASTIILGIITNFIYDKLKKLGKKPSESTAKIDVYYEKTKTKQTTKISYEGPADAMKDTIEKIIDGIERE